MPVGTEESSYGMTHMKPTVYTPHSLAPTVVVSGDPKRYTVETLCLIYGTRIIVDRENTGTPLAQDDLYTVPVGKVFLLVSATLGSCSIQTNQPGLSILQIKSGTKAYGLMDNDTASFATASPQAVVVTNQFHPRIPVRMYAGEKLQTINTECKTTACIFGYEVDAALISQLQ